MRLRSADKITIGKASELMERFGCGGLVNQAHHLDAMRDGHLGANILLVPVSFRGARRIADLVDLGDGSLMFGKDAQDTSLTYKQATSMRNQSEVLTC